VPSVLAALRSGRPIDVTAGEQMRDYLHVSDVASGIAALAQPGARGIFNVCGGTSRPLRDVLEALGRLTGRVELLRFGARPYAPDEVMHLAGRSERLRALGWAPRFAILEDGLADVLAKAP
jgi:nucleoside-diphosphate-sugar epimerase